jgi:hypothetical protein
MKDILIIVSIPFLLSCEESVSESKTVSAGKEETINVPTQKVVQTMIQDTIPSDSKTIHSSNDNLKKYAYPNLTAWGGLSLKYDKNELRIIEARQNAELGFREKEYYLENGEIVKIVFISHQANWGEYEEKYGKEDFDESKITYSDRKVIYNSHDIQTIKTDELEQLLSTGKQILNFIKTEKLHTANTK